MEDPGRISFLGARCPKGFRLDILTLRARDAIGCQSADWADTLVVVEHGQLEVECRGGARARFDEGAILSFTRVELLQLRNPGSGPLVLSALSRLRPTAG